MGYFLVIWPIVTYIEKRIKTKLQYADLEREIGFSSRIFGMFLQSRQGDPCRRTFWSEEFPTPRLRLRTRIKPFCRLPEATALTVRIRSQGRFGG